MTNDAAARLAEFLRLVRLGLSQREAARVAGVSRETLHRKPRSSPEFAAALHDALALGADIRAGQRNDKLSEDYFALAVETAEEREEWKPRKKETTKRERKLLAKLHGHSPSIYPGCSPSHSHEAADPLERLSQRHIRAKMADAFAKRRAEKCSVPAPKDHREHSSEYQSGKGRAGVLW